MGGAQLKSFAPLILLRNIYNFTMKSKITQEIDEYVSEETMDTRQLQFNAYKAKQAVREQRKLLQRRLFGEHFNYQRVGINKDKKYLLEEQRNTEIERSNRILL